MTIPQRWKVESLFYRLALGASLIVFLISVFNGFGVISIILRTALSFMMIYFLGQGLLMLWQIISPPPGQYSGRYFDMFVGEDNLSHNQENEKTGERLEGLPGQVRMDIKNGLPEDADTKAELVRRMGWGKNQE